MALLYARCTAVQFHENCLWGAKSDLVHSKVGADLSEEVVDLSIAHVQPPLLVDGLDSPDKGRPDPHQLELRPDHTYSDVLGSHAVLLKGHAMITV